MATLVKYVGPLVRVTVRASDGIEYTCPAGSSVSLPDDTAIALFAEGTFTAPDGSTPGFVPSSPVVYEEVFLANGVLSKNGTSSGSTVPVAVGGGISGATGGKLAVTDPSSPHGLIEGVATSLVVTATSAAGAPTTGTWLTGQTIIDDNGVTWTCTAGGTPGTWAQGQGGGAANPLIGGTSGPPAWAAATAYAVNRIVTYRGNTWVCITAHTSASTFTADVANWIQIGNVPNLNLFSPRTFGGVGDCRVSATGATSGGASFHDTTAAWFTAADVGKTIAIQGAGSLKAGGVHTTFVTTIATFVSATAVTLTASPPVTLATTTYVLGTDDGAAIQAAANASEAQYAATGIRSGVQVDAHYLSSVSITSGINTSWIGPGVSIAGIHAGGTMNANAIIAANGSSGAPVNACVYKGFELDGLGHSASNYGVGFKCLTASDNFRCVFADLWVHDAPATGLAFDGPEFAVCYGVVIQNNGRLNDGTETSTGIGGNGIGNGTGSFSNESAIIDNCHAIGNAKHGIYWECTGGFTRTSQYIVSNCTATGNGASGFADNSGSSGGASVNGSRAIFANCHAFANGRNGFACETSLSGSHPGNETLFTGCVSDGNGGAGVFYNGSQINSTAGLDGKMVWDGGRICKNGTLLVLNTALTTGAAITTLPVTTPTILPVGQVVTVMSGSNQQSWTLTAQAIANQTGLTVTSQTPNFAYPTTSKVVNGTSAPGISLGMGTLAMQGFAVKGGADIYQNVSSGILINQITGTGAMTDLDLRDCNVWGNCTGDPSNTSGIKIANTTTTGLQLLNNHCWDPAGGGGTQISGVEFATGATITGLNMQGNDLRGNVTNALLNNATVSGEARNNPGYNPVGSQTVSVPATTVAVAAALTDRLFYVTANASGTTSVSVSANGSAMSLTIPASATVPVKVPAGQTLTPTYTAAPTWAVYAE